MHLIFDEADMWAPERMLEKEGELPKLKGQMETIVRRGRVRGFIPWLITQRPAVISKDVLSQADGLVAMKLTASQDRKALGAWIEGQADRAEEGRILARLPQVERGHGVVWIPGRGILEDVAFPLKTTFDSSRTPERGEKKRHTELNPIDLGALKERLASVEKEVASNDPKALRKRIAELERAMSQKTTSNEGEKINTAALEAEAERRGYTKGEQAGYGSGYKVGYRAFLRDHGDNLSQARNLIDNAINEALREPFVSEPTLGDIAKTMSSQPPQPRDLPVRSVPAVPPVKSAQSRPNSAPIRQELPKSDGALPNPQQRILDALAELEALGISQASRIQVAFLAGYGNLTSKGFSNGIGALRSSGMLDYPSTGTVALTDAGRRVANYTAVPLTTRELQDRIMILIGGPAQRILRPLIQAYPKAMPRSELTEKAGYTNQTSKGFSNTIGRLRSLGLLDYPAQGVVRASGILFLEGR